MGHTRLGSIPKSKKWSTVVGLFTAGGEIAASNEALTNDVLKIANQALEAAEVGLTRAIDDAGLRYAFFLLTQIVLAARDESWENRLSYVGIKIPEDASLFDFTVSVQSAIDDYLNEHAYPTDVSEMAQQAVGEAISSLSETLQLNIFGNRKDELKAAIYEISTKKGFSQIGQKFFGRFMTHFLNFYLSRITAAHIGQNRLQQVGDISKFNDVLRLHCEQSARIVYDFCGEWYSKTEFKEGINLDNTSRFMAVALKKLQSELKVQRAEP
jgi:hypothetical protein